MEKTDFAPQIAQELGLAAHHVGNVIRLLDEGATIPFIARYRKEMTGTMNEENVADVQKRLEQLTELRAPVVEVLPHTSEVAKFYNSIDILVLPSWRETMPLVVLEALQAGVCVLQTNRSGMNELIEDGKESLFFSPDDADTLYQLLMQCMNPDFRQTIALAGQQKVQQLIKDSSFDTQITQLLCE